MCCPPHIIGKVKGDMVVANEREAVIPYQTVTSMNHKAWLRGQGVRYVLRNGSKMDDSGGATQGE
jgi:hypothetical protein